MTTAATATSRTPDVGLEEYLAALYPPATPGDLLAYVKKPFRRRFGATGELADFAGRFANSTGRASTPI